MAIASHGGNRDFEHFRTLFLELRLLRKYMSKWTIGHSTKVIMKNVSYRNQLHWLSLTLLAVCAYPTSAAAQVGQIRAKPLARVEIASVSPRSANALALSQMPKKLKRTMAKTNTKIAATVSPTMVSDSMTRW